MRNGRSRSSKVVDFGVPIESVYATSYYPVVVNSHLGPILPRFIDIAGYCTVAPLFQPNFVGVPLGLDCRADVGDPRSEGPKITVQLLSK